jgi:hypothetical protein
MTSAKEKFAVMEWTTMPLRFLVFYLAVATTSKKTVVLELNTKDLAKTS